MLIGPPSATRARTTGIPAPPIESVARTTSAPLAAPHSDESASRSVPVGAPLDAVASGGAPPAPSVAGDGGRGGKFGARS